MSQTTDSTVRKILDNEFAQIGGICVAIWFFVVNVILPISNIEAQLSNIQVTLADIKTTNSNLDTRITTNANSILVLKQQFSQYFEAN